MKAAVSLLLAVSLAVPAWPAGVPASFASRGVGGGGALYGVSINPADPNELTLSCDMSHALLSLDGGSNWKTSDFRGIQVKQTSQILYCTDAGTGQHRLFTMDARQALDETDLSKPMMSAIMTSAMTASGAAFTKVTGWANSRLAGQIFADPNRIDRVIAIESNAGSTNPANLWVSAYDAATNGPKFPTTPATFSGSVTTLPNKARIAGVFFDGTTILLATNAGLFISTDSGLTFTDGPALPLDSQGRARGFISMAGAKQGGQIRLYAVGGPASATILFNINSLSLTSNLVFRMDWSLAGSGSWVQDMAGIDNSGSAGPPADPADYPNIIAMAPYDINTVYVACGRRFQFPDSEAVYKKTSSATPWVQSFTAIFDHTNYDNGNVEPGWLGFTTQPVSPAAGMLENGLSYNTPCSLCVNPSDVNDVIVTNVVWQQVASYPFRAPTRAFYDPNHTERIWITSNGNGLRFAYRPGSFSEWQLQQFGAQAGDISIAGPNADPDGDGLTNMMEYALKTNPLVATNPGVVNTAPYGPYLSASLAKNPVAVDIVWSIGSGTDLATWSSTGATTIQNDESIFWARSLLTIGSVPRLFLRLKCTLLP